MSDQPTPNVERLIAHLHDGGERHSAGAFTLDRVKAREKMRQFQLADPHRYVLELVQAAAAKGATRVRFDIDADDMRMRFDGRPFSAADFEILYNAMFTRVGRPDGEAVAQLALGLNAAMALNPRWIRVRSGAAGQGATLEMRPGREDAFQDAALDLEGTEIHVKARFRPGLAVTFFHNLKGTLPEEQLLRERCGYARFPIDLEGEVISSGPSRPALVGAVSFDDRGVTGQAGYLPGYGGEACVHLVKGGVWIARHPIRGVSRDFWAVVECAAFRKDVSQLDIVKDEAYATAREVLRDAHRRSLAEVARQLRARLDGEALTSFPQDWAFDLCHRALEKIPPDALRSESPQTLGYHLARVPLWPTLGGTQVDYVTLREAGEKAGFVGWTPNTYREYEADEELNPAALAGDDPVLVMPVAEEREGLKRLLGKRFVSVTRKLNRRIKTVKNRRLWRLRPTAPRLAEFIDAHRLLGTHAFESEAARGEVGLVRGGKQGLLFVVVDGCALCHYEADLQVPGLAVALEAPLTPNRVFDGVRRDKAFAAALLAALDALAPLFEGQAQKHSAAGGDFVDGMERRRMMWGYLISAAQEGFPGRFLEAFGAKSPSAAIARRDTVAALRAALAPPTKGEPDPSLGVALARVPLLRGVGDGWFSLAELGRWAAAGEPIRWVDRSVPRQGAQAEPFLWLDESERQTLAALFGGERLEDATARWQYRLQEAAFVAQQPHPGGLDAVVEVPTAWRARFRAEGLEGEVGLAYPSGSGASLWPVHLLFRRRLLCRHNLDLVLPVGAAVVQHEALRPNEDFDDVREDEAYQRALGAVREAAGTLVAYLARHLEQVGPAARPSVVALLRGALAAWIPTRNFGRAFLALRAARSPDRADAEYQALHRLLGSVELVFVDAALGETLDAGECPDAAVVTSRIRPAVTAAAPVEVQVDLAQAAERFAALVPRATVALPPFAALRSAALFEDDEGRGCTLDEVLGDYDEHGEVPFVEEAMQRTAVEERRILRLSTAQQPTLRHLFGHESLVDGKPLMQAALQRQRFDAQQTTTALSVPEGAVLLKRALAAPDVTGEVGLSASTQPGSWLHLYWKRRRLCSVEKFSRYSLVAVANDDRVSPTAKFAGVERDAAYGRVVRACQAEVPALLGTLADRWPDLEPGIAEIGFLHVLDYLSRGNEPLEAQLSRTDPLILRLVDLPGLPGVDGTRKSLRQLHAAARKHGRVGYLPSRFEGEVVDPSRELIVTKGATLRRLRQLFDKVTDETSLWNRDQLMARLDAADAPALPERDRMEGIVRLTCVVGRAKGTLYLPTDPDTPLRVQFGVGGRVLFEQEASQRFPCAGVFEVPLELAQQGGEALALSDEQRQELEREAVGLYRRLVPRFPRLSEGPVADLARERLRAVLLGLVREENTLAHPLPARWQKLLNQLADVRLFEVDGRWCNLIVVRRDRPAALAHLGLWEVAEEPAPEEPAPEEPAPEEPAPEEPASESPELPSAPAPAALAGMLTTTTPPQGVPVAPGPVRKVDVAPVVTREEAPPPVPPLPKPPPPPEDVLAKALRRELRAIAGEAAAVLRHVDLRHIGYDRRRRDTAVFCDDDGIVLNHKHPLVAEALEAGPEDPLLVTYLASAIYTAVNIRLEQVTDDDERVFTRLVAVHVTRRHAVPLAPEAEEPST